MPFLTANDDFPSPLPSSFIQEDKSMPIAIVGMACRLPGEATSPDKLWKLCAEKQAAWSDVPRDRMNLEAFYHPDGERAGNMNNRGGHFLKQDIGAFDASFFSISPTEAMSMDPQQRLLLECVYEALESGGRGIEDVAGSLTSCFVGNFSRDYYDLMDRDVDTAPLYSSTGNASAILSNRVSYFYDFKGPSVTLDTACSSSLVALHLACQSLRTGESKQSVVGATNLIMSPDIMISMCKLHFLSPDSRCYTYDSRANGYSRGEGITALVLKPLEDAINDNDTIRAVIRGSATNQDGRTSGIMMPSRTAQEELIRTAYRNAGCDFSETAYFESHGTGTQAGDPIESGAIGHTIGQNRLLDDEGVQIPLYVGSVKTNIGHTEGASGLAGVIKAVLSLEKGAIAPNLHFKTPNPQIDFKGWNLRVPTGLTPWPHEGQRRVSINSFGFGGTNGHVILDDAYHYLARRGLKAAHRTSPTPILDVTEKSNGNVTPGPIQLQGRNTGPKENAYGDNRTIPAANRRYRVFLWSTHEESIAAMNNEAYAENLAQRENKIVDEEAFLDNLAYTLCSRRSLLQWRSFLVANSLSDLVDKIIATRQKAVRAPTSPPRLAFVFTGQGAQWFAMGRELSKIYPVFQKRIKEADLLISKLGADWSLIDELNKSAEDSRISESFISQTACTALQIALVDLLASWRIRPGRVIGHSSGEIAAGYVSGILPFESALRVAYYRGLHSGLVNVKLPSADGAMMAVGLSETDAKARIAELDPVLGKAMIACINSPTNVTVSGDRASLEALAQTLSKSNVFARFLKVHTAYHSHHMEAVASEYEQSLSDIEVHPANEGVEMISTVTGELVTTCKILGPKYWSKNMTSCVRFNDAMQTLCTHQSTANLDHTPAANRAPVDVLLEVGPHAALAGPIKQILQASSLQKSCITYQSILKRGQDACETALQAAAFLFARGYPVDLTKVNNPNGSIQPQVIVDLPTYFWNHRRRHWMESRLSLEHRFRRHGRNDFLGYPVSDWNPMEPRWRNLVRLQEQPWLKGHAVQGSYIYPGMGYICMAIEAIQHLREMPEHTASGGTLVGYRLQDVSLSRALVIPPTEEGVETVFSLRHHKESSVSFSNKWYEFRVFSYSSDGWAEHAHGLISPVYESVADQSVSNFPYLPQLDQVLLEDNFSSSRTADSMYEMVGDVGLVYKEPFRNVSGDLRSKPGAATGTVTVPDTKALMPFNFEYPHLVHPATMDTFVQMIFPAVLHGKSALSAAYMPVFFKGMFISTEISKEPGYRFKCVSTAAVTGAREITTDLMVCDEATRTPMATFEDIKCNKLEAPSHQNDDDRRKAIRKLCFHSTWQPDPALLSRTVVDQMMLETYSPPEDPSRVSNLETIAYYYCIQTLKNLIEEHVGYMKPHFQKLYRYMQYQQDLVREHKIAHQTTDWEQLENPEVAARIQELISCIEMTSIDSQIICRVGRQLDKIILGEVDALAVMLEDGLLYQYYAQMLDTSTLYRYAKMLSNANPNMDVLEIGAGTGGATESILQAMGGNNGQYSRFRSYTFTDISSGFFEQAENKFKDWRDLIEFRRLNIEEDPVQQGFAEQRYDLVVAGLVLHATSDIEQTIANTRKLLKPGGRLIVIEITNALNQISIPFGCLPGWWMSKEGYRKWGPTMGEQQWAEALKRHGFSDFTLAVPDNLDSRDEMGRTFSCVAVEPVPAPVELPSVLSVVLVSSDQVTSSPLNTLGQELVQHLAGLGVPVCSIPLSRISEVKLTNAFCVSVAELDRAIIRDMKQSELSGLQHIIRSSKGLLWVTQGACNMSRHPDSALFHGMARTLRSENESFPLVTADFATVDIQAPGNTSQPLLSLLRFILDNSGAHEEEYWHDGRCWQINRCIESSDMNRVVQDLVDDQPSDGTEKIESQPFYQPGRPLKMNINTPGLLDTLVFEDDTQVAEPLGPEEVEIEVKASSINFRDIMICTGQMSDTSLGLECAGTIHRLGSQVNHLKVGQRVAVWSRNTYANYVRTDARLVQPISDDMSYAVGASIPIVFTTAIYALLHIARLRKGESVLIHAAAGGVGQAAIIVAQLIGADVFVTVGTQQKKDLMHREFRIPEERIFSSRDHSFARQIKELTGGWGVNVVLNSLAGEALSATWDCIARFGRFVEIGKKDILDNRRLDMAPFIHNVTFSAIDLNTIRWYDTPLAGQLLQEAMEMLRTNEIRPIPCIKSFSFSQLEEAFRFVQAGKHVGKIVMVPHENDIVPAYPCSNGPVILNEDASYLIAGFGGLGRSVARWMVSRGAKNLIFSSRSGTENPEAKQLVEELTQSGVRIELLQVDITVRDALQGQLNRVLQFLPPLQGVIQGAMVLEDQVFDNMSLESFNRGLRPKVQGSWNLHEATLGQPLDFFVMLSSSVGIVGNPGQANYAAGNAYEDALAEHLRTLDRPATSIDLGLMLDIGLVAEEESGMKRRNLERKGFVGMKEDEFFAILEIAIQGLHQKDRAAQIITGIQTKSLSDERESESAVDKPSWMSSPIFSHLSKLNVRSSSTNKQGTQSTQTQLEASESINEAVSIVLDAITVKLSRSLMIDAVELDPSRPTSTFGIDSLIAVELRNWFQKEMKAEIPVFEILQANSLQNLAYKVTEKSSLVENSSTEV